MVHFADVYLEMFYLTMKLDRVQKVPQKIVGVSQVPVGSALSSTIPKFFDQTQVHPI